MHKPRRNVDLVIPFNNEKLNLKILLPKIFKTAKKIKFFNIRVVFIDDGSTDSGIMLIKKYQKKIKNIKFLRNKIKKGQTYCYKSYLNKFSSNIETISWWQEGKMTKQTYTFSLFKINNQIVGVSGIDHDDLEIRDDAVHKDYQKMGIYKRLMKHTNNWLKMIELVLR